MGAGEGASGLASNRADHVHRASDARTPVQACKLLSWLYGGSKGRQQLPYAANVLGLFLNNGCRSAKQLCTCHDIGAWGSTEAVQSVLALHTYSE